ncbi:antitoxin [Nocardia sp. NPDC127579]|uniref:antitoxin n=1 Tax=Nocardia sp. NPDC127579 TaxID=3345402 RepID=UPI00362B3541
MSTIQVRNISEEDAEFLRSEAAAEGMSLQAFMRREVTALARRRAKRAALIAYREELERDPGPGIPAGFVEETLRELRGE